MNLWNIKAKLYRYFRQKSIFGRILQRENANLYQLLDLIPQNPEKIIDLGCGDGNVLHILKNHFPKAQITGLDFNYSMLKNIDKEKNIHPLLGDVIMPPLKRNAFDICTAVGLTEYLQDYNLLFTNLNYILKNGAYVIITFAPTNILTSLRRIHQIKIYPFDEKKFKQTANKMGFIIIDKKNSIMQIQYLMKLNN